MHFGVQTHTGRVDFVLLQIVVNDVLFFYSTDFRFFCTRNPSNELKSTKKTKVFYFF